jgi:hypothetical protein
MHQTSVAKKFFESKSDSRGKMTRPRLRWPEDAENDLRDSKANR